MCHIGSCISIDNILLIVVHVNVYMNCEVTKTEIVFMVWSWMEIDAFIQYERMFIATMAVVFLTVILSFSGMTVKSWLWKTLQMCSMWHVWIQLPEASQSIRVCNGTSVCLQSAFLGQTLYAQSIKAFFHSISVKVAFVDPYWKLWKDLSMLNSNCIRK